MELLIMQFSRTSCHFIPLGFEHSPQRPVYKHPLCTSSNVRDQLQQPCKTTGKSTVLCILMITFSDRRWGDKRFSTARQEAFPEFRLLSVSPNFVCFPLAGARVKRYMSKFYKCSFTTCISYQAYLKFSKAKLSL
jgi:hypothetical protein